MSSANAACLWCNIGDCEEVDGILEVLGRLRQRVPDLTAIVTGGRGVRFPDRIPEGVTTVQKPYDLPQSIERFLDLHRPKAALLTGSDLFPSAIATCGQRQIPMILANATFRTRGMIQERLMDFRLGARLRAFERIFAVERADAEHFVRKGAPQSRIAVLGRLEAPTPAPPCDEEERQHLADLLSTRPVWLAADLPVAELETVEAAFRVANNQTHRLLLVVTPADLASGADVAAFFEAAGWATAQRENGEEPEQDVHVYVADAPDEAGLWYRLAPITYLGGTLSACPCADPFHPAALGSAVLHGHRLADPSPHLARLVAEGAVRGVAKAEDLAAAVSELLSPDRAAHLAGRAWDVTSRSAEAAERAADAIAAMLARSAA